MRLTVGFALFRQTWSSCFPTGKLDSSLGNAGYHAWGARSSMVARPTTLEQALIYYQSFSAASAAFIVCCTFAIAGFSIAAAATKEEVAHCRGIDQQSERLDCFKSLKHSAKSRTEQSPTRRDPAEAANDAVKPTADDPQRVAPSQDPTTTGSIGRRSFASGQPLCKDRDALGAAILAGLLTSDPTKATTIGCQSIPEDAELELLERSPGIFSFIRIIRVKVTSRTKPDVESGFTIELGPNGPPK
jgi:hypothetical protein